jgi:iron complex outermembrane receptor protein
MFANILLTMKKALFLTIFFCSVNFLFAQQPNSTPNTRIMGANVYGKIYGKVLNASTKEPVAYATVTVLNMRDSLLGGALVKNNGDFNVEKVPIGRMKVQIQFIGYKKYTQLVTVTPKLLELDLGNIKLEQDAAELTEVEIRGQKQAVIMNIDKRVYNVDRDISIQGGNGLDVMKNVPGVSVDGEGNVTIRNGSPIIFIDSRPSVMTLEQIPAEQIEKIEIITNPSAKYDAASNNGILNVILKKNSKPGYNGMINAGLGTNRRYNSMLNLNVKEKNFNFFGSYNINTRGNINEGYTYRTNLLGSEVTSYFKQDNVSNNFNVMQFGRFGFDWNMTNRSMITVSQAFNIFDMRLEDRQDFTFENKREQPISQGYRDTEQRNFRRGLTSQVQFKHNFPKQGKELVSDITVNNSTGNAFSQFETQNYDMNGILFPNNPELQLNRTLSRSTIYTYQLDFTNPRNDTSKWEMGLRSDWRQDRSILDVQLGNNRNNLLRDTVLSNNFQIDEFISAAYVTYTDMLGSIGYQAGLRFEQTHFTGRLLDKDVKFQYIYPQGLTNLRYAFFPSLYLNKRFSQDSEMQLNFTRKIKRPGWMQVVPFILFADRQSYRIGNPNLAPEFINNMELNYNKIFKRGSFLTSAYFKLTENVITNYVYTYYDEIRQDSSILISTFINGNRSYVYGWENTAKVLFFKNKMDITLNWNIFYTDISAQSVNLGALQNRGFSWDAKSIFSYRLPKNYTVQITGTYRAPQIIPQGTTIDVYFIDFSLAKQFNKKFSMNFTVSDIFNTKRWGAFYNTPVFDQEFARRWESRYARITLSYRFGETDQSLFKRKSNIRRDRETGGEQMDF